MRHVGKVPHAHTPAKRTHAHVHKCEDETRSYQQRSQVRTTTIRTRRQTWYHGRHTGTLSWWHSIGPKHVRGASDLDSAPAEIGHRAPEFAKICKWLVEMANTWQFVRQAFGGIRPRICRGSRPNVWSKCPQSARSRAKRPTSVEKRPDVGEGRQSLRIGRPCRRRVGAGCGSRQAGRRPRRAGRSASGTAGAPAGASAATPGPESRAPDTGDPMERGLGCGGPAGCSGSMGEPAPATPRAPATGGPTGTGGPMGCIRPSGVLPERSGRGLCVRRGGTQPVLR